MPFVQFLDTVLLTVSPASERTRSPFGITRSTVDPLESTPSEPRDSVCSKVEAFFAFFCGVGVEKQQPARRVVVSQETTKALLSHHMLCRVGEQQCRRVLLYCVAQFCSTASLRKGQTLEIKFRVLE